MKAVIQRVLSASVEADGCPSGTIERGMVVLVAAEVGDTDADVVWLANRVSGLRIFEDQAGKMNLACADIAGAALIVSNFTVAGNAQKGMRPSFDRAAPFEQGRLLYEKFLGAMRSQGLPVETGVYGAEMKLSLVNDGPVTIIVESPRG